MSCYAPHYLFKKQNVFVEELSLIVSPRNFDDLKILYMFLEVQISKGQLSDHSIVAGHSLLS